MKKIALATAFAGLFSLSQADASCELLTEVRAAYYHPTSKKFRDIYGGSGIYNVELSLETWCNFYPFISAGYYRESGRSIGERNKTTLTMVPLGIGLKYLFCPCSCYHPYLGAGFAASWMHTRDSSPFIHKTTKKWGFGGVFKVGVLAFFTDCFFVDGFIDYTYMKVHFSGSRSSPLVFLSDADLSGFAFGLGIGFAF